MTYKSQSPQVGDILVGEIVPIGRSWTVTKVWKSGARVTVRTTVVDGQTVDGGPESVRQVCRQRFGTWKLGHQTVQFERPSIGAVAPVVAPVESAQPTAPSYQAVLLEKTAETVAQAETSVSGLDLVKPLVAVALRLYRESLEVRLSVAERKVDPSKSPLVAQAAQRFAGACEMLSAMWIQLGAANMTPERARRAVLQVAADEVERKHQQVQALWVTDEPTLQQLVAHVQQHARENYDRDGWDFIIETYTDAELGELLQKNRVTGYAAAVEFAATVAGMADEVREERRPRPGIHY